MYIVYQNTSICYGNQFVLHFGTFNFTDSPGKATRSDRTAEVSFVYGVLGGFYDFYIGTQRFSLEMSAMFCLLVAAITTAPYHRMSPCHYKG